MYSMIPKKIFISFIWLGFLVQSVASAESKVLFKSGFEGHVMIASIGKRHKIVGSDGPFTWPTDLPGAGNRNYFNYVVSRKKDSSKFIDTKILKITGPDGQPTRTLYQAIKKNDVDTSALSRNQYNMFSSLTADSFQQMYVKYWIKFQPDLDKVMAKKSWRMVMEWHESGRDYRFNLQVIRQKTTSKLRWRLLGQIRKPQKKYDWIKINDKIPVPIGEWFLLEAFWKHSSGPDGRIFIKVNGKEVFDKKGRNKLNSDLYVIMPFKLYGGTDYYQWIDDFEIRDNLPDFESKFEHPLPIKPSVK